MALRTMAGRTCLPWWGAVALGLLVAGGLPASATTRGLVGEAQQELQEATIITSPEDLLGGPTAPGPPKGKPETLAELLAMPEGGDLEVSVLAVPFRLPEEYATPDHRAAVPILVEIDGPSLIGRQIGSSIPTEIHAYAFNSAGAVVEYFSLLLSFDADRQRDRIAAGGVKFQGRLDLPPGTYDLRVMVRNSANGSQAVTSAHFDVPDFAADELALLPPLVEEPPNRWLLVHQDRPPADRHIPYPFAFGPRDVFVPAARPAFTKGQSAAIGVFGYNLPEGDVSIDAQLLDSQGYVVLGQQLSVLERAPTEEGRPERILAGLDLPGVKEGAYTLKLGVTDPRTGQRGTSSIPIVVSDVSPPLRRAEVETEEQRISRSRRIRALAVAYREVLSELGAGLQEAAAERLTGMESDEAAASRRRNLEHLRDAELAVARALAEQQPAAVIPLLKLHFDAYLIYLDRRQMLLARHSRTMVEELADFYEEIGAPPAARRLAARALTSLGGVLQQNGATAPGNVMFEHALELDKGNEAALLGLGAYYEKVGDYPRALTYLETLVASHPDSAEGWLRYGINLARVGRGLDARRWMERAVSPAAPPWVRSLGYQELARLHIEEKRLEAAESLLRQAVAELPGEQGLYLQLAHVLDRMGRRGEATAVLTRIETDALGGSESARYRYNRWPTQVIERGLELLANNASESLPTLAQAIGRSSGGGP